MKSAGSLNFLKRSQNHFLKTFDSLIFKVFKKPETRGYNKIKESA